MTYKNHRNTKAGFDFNSHAHVERDYNIDDIDEKIQYFNSHAHVERDMGAGSAHGRGTFQLTRSRGA